MFSNLILNGDSESEGTYIIIVHWILIS